MIENVIDYLNTKLLGLNVFKEVKGLCELIIEDERTYPAIYQGKDNLRFVTSYDYRNGLVFHIKNGHATITELERVIASSSYKEYSHPVRAVLIHGRGIYEDNNYSQEKIASNVVNAINKRSIPSLRAVIGVDRVSVQVNGYSTDKADLQQYFQGIELDIRHDLDVVIVDYNIILRANQSCFDNYGCGVLPIQNDCEPVTIQNSDSSYIAFAECGATFILPNEDYEIYVDSVLVDSGSFPVYGSQTITINL